MVFTSKKNAKKSECAPSGRREMNLTEAAHLTDKNSRTIVKLCQLLEVQKKEALSVVEIGQLSRRIEKLKMRLNRRVIRLAKWVDKPEHERNGFISYSTRASSTTTQPQVNRGRGRPRGPNYKGPYKDRTTNVPVQTQSNLQQVHSHNTYMEAFNKAQQALFQSSSYTKSVAAVPGAQQRILQPVATSRPAIAAPAAGSASHLSTLIDLQRKMAQSTSNALAGGSSKTQPSS